MTRYHFHSGDGVRFYDTEGTELSDDAAAQNQAVQLAGEMLKDDPDTLWRAGHWRVEVTDDSGDLLCTVITLAVDAPRKAEMG